MSEKNENAVINFLDLDEEELNIEDLEASLEAELESQFSDLSLLEEEREKIGNPDNLGNVIADVVWEQFLNQVAVTAGEDFVKENNGLYLDLRKEAHIQTAENFANGNIASHNYISKEQLQQNYDRYKNTPHKEFRDKYVDPGMNATLKRAGELKKQGIDMVTDIYTGKPIPTETKLDNGKNNPKAAQREHVKPSAELYEKPSLQMSYSNDELASIINNPENLQGYTTAERNIRKSDKSAEEMDKSDKTEHWKKADERANEYIKKKENEGEERLKKEGHKTQKEEAFRISGKALRVVLMQLLAELVKEIIAKLIKWFKSSEKKLDTLLTALKESITSFVGKQKTHLINAADTALTIIASAIFGPVINTIKKVWIMLKQGWQSLKKAIAYIKNPENKEKPIGILMLEVGKIVMAGLSAAGAIILGEVIEKALIAIPGAGIVFAFEIPLLGSLANILGIFLGAVVAGIIGAIIINLIDRCIAKRQKNDNLDRQLDKKNEILQTQDKLINIKIQKLVDTKEQTVNSMLERREQTKDMISEALVTIFREDDDSEYNAERLSSTADELSKLLG